MGAALWVTDQKGPPRKMVQKPTLLRERELPTAVWVPQRHAMRMLTYIERVNGNSTECCTLSWGRGGGGGGWDQNLHFKVGTSKHLSHEGGSAATHAIRKVLSSFALTLFEGHVESLTGDVLVTAY